VTDQCVSSDYGNIKKIETINSDICQTEESSEWFLPEEKLRLPKISNGILVGVYTGISKSSTVPFVYLRSLFASLLGLKASKAFFSGISNSLFKAPMLFFDSTPGGRIYTRVSRPLHLSLYK